MKYAGCKMREDLEPNSCPTERHRWSCNWGRERGTGAYMNSSWWVLSEGNQ